MTIESKAGTTGEESAWRSVEGDLRYVERYLAMAHADTKSCKYQQIDFPEWEPSEGEPKPLMEAVRYSDDLDAQPSQYIYVGGGGADLIFCEIGKAIGTETLRALVAENERLNGGLVAGMQVRADGGGAAGYWRPLADLIAERSHFDEDHYARQRHIQREWMGLG